MPATTNRKTNPFLWLVIGGFIFLFVAMMNATSNSADLCGSGRSEIEEGICSTKNGYESVSIVVGNTQNSPLPEINLDSKKTEDVRDVITDVFYAAGKDSNPAISIVSAADLEPITFDEPLAGPAAKTSVSEKRLEDNLYMINRAMQSQPKRSGVDYLQAIINASRYLDKNEKSAIIVIGSGYNDAGDLNFATDNQLLSKDTRYAVSLLESDSRLDKTALRGVDVYWLNLGVTVSPQADLSDYIDVTENIYNEALYYLGASSNIKLSYDDQYAKYSVDTKLKVTPVVPQVYTITGKTFNMNEKVGAFNPDQATLKNESEVTQWLKENIVNNYEQSGRPNIDITGYIAFCATSNSLSIERAETVKTLLVNLGLPADKIRTAGEAGPPDAELKHKDCNTSLPDSERRTVVIEAK